MPSKGFRKALCIRGHNRLGTNKACKECIQLLYRAENTEHKQKRHCRLLNIKKTVLSFYGKNQTLHCNWPCCDEIDIDVLTLDHIKNDGYKDRHGNKGASKLYAKLIREQFPEGFQTLCANHQLKKEILRRCSLLEVSIHA